MPQLERHALHAEMKSILQRAEAEHRELTAAEDRRFNQLDATICRLDTGNITQRARVATDADKYDIPRTPFDDSEAKGAFSAFVRTGVAANCIRAAQTTNGAGGGYLIPQLFQRQLTSILKQYDRLFDPDVIQLIETEDGNPMAWPMLDDVATANAAQIVNENVITPTGPDLAFNQTMLGQTPTWRTGLITVPIPLLQDSGIPIDELLVKAFAVRLARGIGASVVSTLTTNALVGSTTAGGQTSTIIEADIYNLMGSVDPAYQTNGGSRTGWAMNFQTLLAVLQIKDSTGRPIFKVHYDANGNVLLLQKPVFICPSMPAPAAGATPIAYGDFSRLLLRVVRDSQTIVRMVEAPGLAENYCVGFVGFLRAASALLLDLNQSPADSPIKLLKNATS